MAGAVAAGFISLQNDSQSNCGCNRFKSRVFFLSASEAHGHRVDAWSARRSADGNGHHHRRRRNGTPGTQCDARRPHESARGLFWLWFLGVILGLLISVLSELAQEFRQLINMAMMPLYFISGVLRSEVHPSDLQSLMRIS